MKQITIKGDMPVTYAINQIKKLYPYDWIRDIKMKDNIVSFTVVRNDDSIIRESVQLITEP